MVMVDKVRDENVVKKKKLGVRTKIVKKFLNTFIWALALFTIMLLVYLPQELWLRVFIGPLIVAIFSGIVGIFIPSKKKVIYVTIGVLSGVIFSIIFGLLSGSKDTIPQESKSDEFLSWIKTQSSESLAKSAAEITAKSLPMQIDSLTSFYAITSVGNRITIRVKILTTKSNFISMLNKNGDTISTYIPKFNAMVHNMGCTQKVNRAYIEQGVVYKYFVSDIDLNFLFETSVENCM